MKNPDYNEVYLMEPQPNRMFPDWMHKRLRGLRYAVAVPCACCGKKSKTHWTLLMSFKACIPGRHQFKLDPEPTVHLPMTPVCRGHILVPMMPTVEAEKATTKTEDAKAARKRKFYGQGD